MRSHYHLLHCLTFLCVDIYIRMHLAIQVRNGTQSEMSFFALIFVIEQHRSALTHTCMQSTYTHTNPCFFPFVTDFYCLLCIFMSTFVFLVFELQTEKLERTRQLTHLKRTNFFCVMLYRHLRNIFRCVVNGFLSYVKLCTVLLG